MPAILESGLTTAKKTLQSGDDILQILSVKEKQALLDQLDELGIKDVSKVEIGSDGLKIHTVDGIVDAKWTDEIVEGASDLISEADRLKISNWEYTPSDDLYLKYKNVYDNPKYYNQLTGDIHFPTNDGFLTGTKMIDEVDDSTVFKRYGGTDGEFLGNATDSFESRSLAPHSDGVDFFYYRPIKSFELTSGTAAPWFGSDGGAEQFVKYKADGVHKYTIQEMLDLELIEDITDLVESGEVNIN